MPDAGLSENPRDLEFSQAIGGCRRQFIEAMDDDFNTPLALSVLLSFSRRLETYTAQGPAKKILSEAIAALKDFSSIFGIGLSEGKCERPEITEDLMRLIVELRDGARKRNDWATADKIRERLSALKMSLEDTPEGTRWQRTG